MTASNFKSAPIRPLKFFWKTPLLTKNFQFKLAAASNLLLKFLFDRLVRRLRDLRSQWGLYDGWRLGDCTGWLLSCRSQSQRKVAFGFQSKYTKATNPKGETQINFAGGNLEFNALNYDYLSVFGPRAQFKGFGKVNGDAGYNFLLTVIDGQATNGGGVDRFRIKIWNKVTGQVVFDTQMGESEAADPTTPIGDGGSIVIQK